MTILHVVVLGLPAQERYKKEHMLQVAIIPGDHNGDLYTFLRPLLNELQTLEAAGMRGTCPDGVYSFNVYWMLTSGDIIGVQEICHHTGHTSQYGCRQCRIKTIPHVSPSGNGIGHYYRETVTMSDPREMNEFIDGDKGFGIKKATEFGSLESFHGHTFFGLDELHLIGANCSRKIWLMISGEYKKVNCTIELPKQICLSIGSAIIESGPTIPSSIFEGSFRGQYYYILSI
ncbi:hypothetical protein INT45_003686 [Circinella minor]|uniref:Uncharacterized protein n=1 Tax=Circinella minor TaxID=1195481 RepID=A0A8H7S3J3_9FUNG|nr:hypothetical protein INT45_003686 [Circinella minor]